MFKDDRWLLVFDNADSTFLNDYWPPSSYGSIIVTSQMESLSHRATRDILLEPLDTEEGAEMFLQYVRPPRRANGIGQDKKVVEENWETAKAISIELGGLPLLLSHMAGYVWSSHCPMAEALHGLRTPSTYQRICSFDSSTTTNFQYSEPMAKAWAMALNALSPEARRVLDIMSMLNTEAVSEELLIGDWENPALEFLNPCRRFEYVLRLTNPGSYKCEFINPSNRFVFFPF